MSCIAFLQLIAEGLSWHALNTISFMIADPRSLSLPLTPQMDKEMDELRAQKDAQDKEMAKLAKEMQSAGNQVGFDSC